MNFFFILLFVLHPISVLALLSLVGLYFNIEIIQLAKFGSASTNPTSLPVARQWVRFLFFHAAASDGKYIRISYLVL
jgi:hypothetical protein